MKIGQEELNQWIKEQKKGRTKEKKSWWFRISKRKWFDEWKELTPTQKALLLSLWLYAGNRGQCYPSLRQLSDDLGITYQTTWRNIKILKKKGYFQIEKTKGRGRYFNKYILIN